MKLAKIFDTGTKYFHDEYLEATDDFKSTLTVALIKSALSKRQFYFKLGISKRTFLRWMDTDIPTRKTYEKIKDFL